MNQLDIALATMDKHFDANPLTFEYDSYERQSIRARTRAMIRGYSAYWVEDNKNYIVRDVENVLLGPIKSLETNKELPGMIASGKLDVMVEESGGMKRQGILDHKLLRSGFDNDDIDHLKISGQPLQYTYLGWCNEIRVKFATWDILVKPQHIMGKPRTKIVKGSPEKVLSRANKELGLVKGDIVPAVPDQEVFVAGEDPSEFEERVFTTIMENPAKWFARPKVDIHINSVIEHVQELYEWSKELKLDREVGTHLKNTDACMEYNRPCEYISICGGYSHPIDGSWGKKENVHTELSLPAGTNPFNIITNSRMKTYKLCRRKHHFKYNEGLYRLKQKPDDALYLGDLGHIGLEAFWRYMGEVSGTLLTNHS